MDAASNTSTTPTTAEPARWRASTGGPCRPGWRPTWPDRCPRSSSSSSLAVGPTVPPGHRRRRPRLCAAAATRHHVLATAHDMARKHTVIERAAGDRRARPPHPRAVHRHRGQRRTLLRDVVRRGPHPPRRAGVVHGVRGRPDPGEQLIDRHAGPRARGRRRRRRPRRLRPEGGLHRPPAQAVARPVRDSTSTASRDRPDRPRLEELSAKIPEQQGVAIVTVTTGSTTPTMPPRSLSAQPRHAFQSNRKNWCSTLDPSSVSGTGGCESGT